MKTDGRKGVVKMAKTVNYDKQDTNERQHRRPLIGRASWLRVLSSS